MTTSTPAASNVVSVVDAPAVAAAVQPKTSAMAGFLDDDEEVEGNNTVANLTPQGASVASQELDALFEGGNAQTDSEDEQGSEPDADALSSTGSNAGLEEELTLDDLTDEEGDTPAKVEVYSKDCLSCKALVPWETKTKMSCHYSRGNSHCPALTVQVVTRIPLEKIVPRILQAEAERDTTAIAKFYANLAKRETWQQEIILAAIQDNRT